MTVTELTKEIYKKYPKVWNTMETYFHKYNLQNNDYMLNMIFKDHEIYLTFGDQIEGDHFVIPFNMLYGLLDDFFEDNNIIVFVKPIDYSLYLFEIIDKEGFSYLFRSKFKYNYIESKTEAQIKAILKACEILEREL